ncbi:unknown [Clostridium sp. CAG:306]|nr:unknown [Clostridium sp. CAG:306]
MFDIPSFITESFKDKSPVFSSISLYLLITGELKSASSVTSESSRSSNLSENGLFLSSNRFSAVFSDSVDCASPAFTVNVLALIFDFPTDAVVSPVTSCTTVLPESARPLFVLLPVTTTDKKFWLLAAFTLTFPPCVLPSFVTAVAVISA